MMKSIYSPITVVFLIFSFIFIGDVSAWTEVTHENLSQYAGENSVLRKCQNETDQNCDYLKKLGFEEGLEESLQWYKYKKVTEWLAEGANLEDAGTTMELLCGDARSYNHFHNPLKPWDSAGLNDIILNLCPPPLIPPTINATGQSSLLWMQDSANQLTFRDGDWDWSWQKIRQVYYWALISTTDDLRQVNFAQTFRGLGHQMHLIQDAAQPDHVRNDAHPEDTLGLTYGIRLEKWAGKEFSELQSLREFAPNLENYFPNVPLNISYNNLVSITQFFDTEQYNGNNPSASLSQGMAEYTNANFFTDATTFAAEIYSSDHRHYFPYPRKSSTNLQELIDKNILPETIIAEDGVQDVTLYIKKERDGEQIGHFIKPMYTTTGRWDLVGAGYVYDLDFYRDEKCHNDYASLLIPRAVGYSAGLLNYFFRGTLEIIPPQQVAYAVTDGSITPYVDANGNYHQQFRSIKAGIRNSTPDTMIGEEIQNGIIKAVAKYKIIPNYMYDLSNYPPDGNVMKDVEYSYSVSLPINITSLSSTEATDFTFDFLNSPIPAGITDLYLQVIYKGTLGNEQDIAIAVGMKDLMEPTHQVFWNLTDMYSLDYHLYTSDTIKTTPALADRVDFDHDGVFNETGEPYIDPYPMTFGIGYQSEPLGTFYYSAITTVQPGGHIRLIALMDKPQDNYMGLEESDVVSDTSYFYFTSPGVVNHEVEGSWQTPTPIVTFRYGLDGVTQIPIRQHFKTGVIRCYPLGIDPNGNPVCYYSESEAVPGELMPSQIDTIYFP